MKSNPSKSFKQAASSQLHQNYGILHQLLSREQFQSFKYEQLLYMLLNGRIEMQKISYWKQKKYRNQQPLMRKSFIIQDSIKLREEVVGKAWRFEKTGQHVKTSNSNKPNKSIKLKVNASDIQAEQKQNNQQKQVQNTQTNQQAQHQHESQQQTQQPSLQSSPSPPQRHARSLTTKKQKGSAQSQQMKLKRIKIQDMMTNLQAKMNVSRNQVQAAKYQKQYNQCFKELTDLRNRRRIQRENNLIKKVEQESGKEVAENLRSIIEKMNTIKQNKSKILDKQPQFKQKITKAEQINRLNLIFAFYCKKQTENTNKYFSDMQKSQLALKLQTFIKFVQDWKLARIISMQQIINIFKSHSKGKKSIDSFQFSQVLADVHKCQCIKEDKAINAEAISQFMQEYIVEQIKIKNKILGYVTAEHNQQQNKRYSFKPKCHSGKYLQDIKDQIEERKQTIQFLAGPQNLIKYKKQSDPRSRVSSQVAENSRLDTRTLSSSSLSPSQKQAPFISSSINSLNDSLNSYAFRFKLKNTKSRMKTQGIIKSIQNTKQHKYDNNAKQGNVGFTINVLDSNRENISNRRDHILNENEETYRYDIDDLMLKQVDQKQKKKNPAFEGFQDLIEESEEDQYLNKHLQLPPIKASKAPSRSIHY